MSTTAAMVASTLGHLKALGVVDHVLCAGARNAPLVAALTDQASQTGFRLWHHFDERTAAFFALGLAKKQGRPVGVITTSGTAAAELLPAAVEAYYSSIPLVLVTADRPARYRMSGAPQAIEQVGLFGGYASAMIDAQQESDFAKISSWTRSGPIHLNVCLEEPKVGFTPEPIPQIPLRNFLPEGPELCDTVVDTLANWFRAGDRALIILGELPENWQAPVRQFLRESALPFWAEATSGLREIPELMSHNLRSERELMKTPVDRVCRIGGVPSCRFWRELENLPDIEVLSVSPRPWSGLARPSECLMTPTFPTSIPVGKSASRTSSTDIDRLDHLLRRYPKSEPAVMRMLSEIIPSSALVFLGNSLPIREWNLAASFVQGHPHCRANRGANGIDGEIASFLGLACDEGEAWGIFGDLTALYDLNAPAFLAQMPSGQRRLVVVNNGGGRIFSRLPALASLDERARHITENRHQQSFAGWAELWKLAYVRWQAGEEPPTLPESDLVLEIVVDQADSEAFWREWK
jgi:2-succinyl-5-enolpyruvyl-6-hydroxy-3-cyclohexene-1-carboxylate synthase